MIDRQSLLAQLMMGPPQPATRLSQLAAGAPVDPVDAMRASLPPMATPDTRAGRPNRLAELTMPSAEFEPAVRPFGSPHVPAVTTPSEERRLVDLAMMLAPMVSNIKVFHGSPNVFSAFDRARLGEFFDNRASRAGHWFTTNADDAAVFGDNLYEVTLSGKYAPLPSMEQMADSALARLHRIVDNPNIAAETRRRAIEFIDYINATRDPSFYTNVTASNLSKVKRAGYGGARLRGGETVQNRSAPGDHYVVFDDQLINSVKRVNE